MISLSSFLEGFKDKSDVSQRLFRQRAFNLAFAVTAVPSLGIGILYALFVAQEEKNWSYTLALMALAFLFAGATYWLAGRILKDTSLEPEQAKLTAAMQLASAPLVPFLLGCASIKQPIALLMLWLMAAAFYFLARQKIA